MFLFSHWLNLPITTRIKIASQFNIQKRGSTEVVDNVVKSDGYNIKEIEEALNIDKLQTFLNTDTTDMTLLWSMLIEKIEDPVGYDNKHHEPVLAVDDVQPPTQEPHASKEEMDESIARYEAAKEDGTLDEKFPVIGVVKKNKGGRPKKNV